MRLTNPFTGGRYPADYFRPNVVRDLLLLVSVEVTPALVEGWSEEQRKAAGNWALRVHLKASDNNTVRVPEKPSFVPDFRPINPDARSVMEL